MGRERIFGAGENMGISTGNRGAPRHMIISLMKYYSPCFVSLSCLMALIRGMSSLLPQRILTALVFIVSERLRNKERLTTKKFQTPERGG